MLILRMRIHCVVPLHWMERYIILTNISRKDFIFIGAFFLIYSSVSMIDLFELMWLVEH